MKNSFVAIDVETTGLSPFRGDRVIEIGAARVEDGRIVAEFSQLIRTTRPIHPAAARVHGISSRMLQGKPRAEEVIPVFQQFIGGSLLVAHNARFDLAFLRHEFGRLGFPLNNPVSCSLQLSRRRWRHLRDHKLETVARHLLGPLPEELRLHRALDDARLLAAVWIKLSADESSPS